MPKWLVSPRADSQRPRVKEETLVKHDKMIRVLDRRRNRNVDPPTPFEECNVAFESLRLHMITNTESWDETEKYQWGRIFAKNGRYSRAEIRTIFRANANKLDNCQRGTAEERECFLK